MNSNNVKNEPNELDIVISDSDNIQTNTHYTTIMKLVVKGKEAGKELKHFKCNYCENTYQGPSTGTFLKHLRAYHRNKLTNFVPQAVPPAREFNRNKTEFDKDIFTGKLLKWIVKADQPFSSVENEHFVGMLDYLKADVAIHSRQTPLMRSLDEIYVQKKGDLKKELGSLKSKYSITCDIWTSKNQLAFFGFTMHFIDEDWNYQEKLLAFKYLEDEHDGVSLSKAMIEVLVDLDILPGLLGVTMDDACKNSTMMVELETYYQEKSPSSAFSVAWNQVECMADVINLATKEILKDFREPLDTEVYETDPDSQDKLVNSLSRLSFLARQIKRSPIIRRLMKTICDENEVEFLIPIIDIKSRWNSMYDMLVRAVEMKDIITTTISRHQDIKLMKLLLDENDWVGIEQLIKILQPLKEITLMTCRTNQSLCIAEVLPLYEYCIAMLTDFKQEYDTVDVIKVRLDAAVEKLQHYYDMISPMVGISLILNPTLKQFYFSQSLGWRNGWVDTVMDHFKDTFKHYKERVGSVVAPSPQNTIQDTTTIESGYAMYRKRKRESEISANFEEEYHRYFNEPLAMDGTDVLAYWKSNQFHFPILSAMAKDYLTIQATSVPAERAFSSDTDLDTDELSGPTIEITQFLKFHL